MFDYWYLSTALNAMQKLPKEIVYAATAGLTINEIHKRYSQQKLKEIEVNARVHLNELEVKKLQLKLDLYNARAEKPQP